jgi:aspartyl/asparaginyl beta-hydroxylase (cupin superfamily)
MNFFDPVDFPVLAPLARNWEMIRAEYDTVAQRAHIWPEAIHNGGWSVFGLRFQDRDLPESVLTPVTTHLCSSIPNVHTFGFSIMQPGCEIRPHTGYTDRVLRVHLGLYCNDRCGLKVGDETRSWKPGELLVFNDMIEHSAWNRGATRRAILLLDLYK